MKDGSLSSYLIEDNQEYLKSNHVNLSEEEKMNLIEEHFREIVIALGLDIKNDSLKDSPRRVAKMYVKELFSGLISNNKPSITLFENKYKYDQMLVEKDITLFSTCEHHFVPIIGKAHVAYYSTGCIVGLSKLNRIVNYFSRRPQQQELLTMEIAKEVMAVLKTEDVAVLIEADHLCVKSRGVNDVSSSTISSFYSGKFQLPDIRNEFLNCVRS